MGEFDFQKSKFEQAILLFATHANNGLLGKTKLFKLLYYADFDHFEKYGTPITGETYLRFEHGPFPEHGNEILDKLGEGEILRSQHERIGNYLKFTYHPLTELNVSVFAPEELKTLVEVMGKWMNHNATEMVAATHGEAPWIATDPMEPISYSLAYYRNKFGEMDEFAEDDEIIAVEDTG